MMVKRARYYEMAPTNIKYIHFSRVEGETREEYYKRTLDIKTYPKEWLD